METCNFGVHPNHTSSTFLNHIVHSNLISGRNQVDGFAVIRKNLCLSFIRSEKRAKIARPPGKKVGTEEKRCDPWIFWSQLPKNVVKRSNVAFLWNYQLVEVSDHEPFSAVHVPIKAVVVGTNLATIVQSRFWRGPQRLKSHRKNWGQLPRHDGDHTPFAVKLQNLPHCWTCGVEVKREVIDTKDEIELHPLKQMITVVPLEERSYTRMYGCVVGRQLFRSPMHPDFANRCGVGGCAVGFRRNESHPLRKFGRWIPAVHCSGVVPSTKKQENS